jgi:hypothetical protein
VRIHRFVVPLVLAATLHAWNAAGHRTVAFIAYRSLTEPARARVDRLLQSHPDYSRWVEGVPPADRPLEAFLHASVWADEIKSDPRYQDEPKDQIPSYPDTFRHRNWHYIDKPLVGEFDALSYDENNKTWRNPPTAVSQIRVMEDILRDKHSSDAAKAWAIGWLIHLVGDLQQPLHCVSRDSKNPETGKMEDDQGGNKVRLAGAEHNLHAFWDDALGKETDTPSVKTLGTDLLAVSATPDKKKSDPNAWVEEGSRLSIAFVYRGLAGARSEQGMITVPTAYSHVAKSVAQQRVTLGGYRLAALLNRLLAK